MNHNKIKWNRTNSWISLNRIECDWCSCSMPYGLRPSHIKWRKNNEHCFGSTQIDYLFICKHHSFSFKHLITICMCAARAGATIYYWITFCCCCCEFIFGAFFFGNIRRPKIEFTPKPLVTNFTIVARIRCKVKRALKIDKKKLIWAWFVAPE